MRVNYNPSVGMSIAILSGLAILVLGMVAQWRANRQFRRLHQQMFGRPLHMPRNRAERDAGKRAVAALSGSLLFTALLVAFGLWLYS